MTTRRIVASLAMAVLTVGCASGASQGSVASTGAPPAPSSAYAAASVAIPAALVGAWTTTISEADLRAGGVTAAGELAENRGVFTLRLGADGTWSTAQVSDVPVRWPVFKGTYQATGPDTFRQVTTFPADYLGDAVDFTWSLKDGALVLRVPNPPDPILPIVTGAHPWQPTR